MASVFEPFHDQDFVALKARPGKLEKEFSTLFSAVSYQWDLCVLLLQLVLQTLLSSLPEIQGALLIVLS